MKPNKAKAVFRILDHCSIFLLIAGSYTPIILSLFEGWQRTVFLVSTWGVALFGVLINFIDLKKFEKLSFVCYLAMGWQVVFMAKRLFELTTWRGIVLLLVGGMFYTVGAIFYVIGKKRCYMHSIWHLFVLAGSIFQYFAIVFHIV